MNQPFATTFLTGNVLTPELAGIMADTEHAKKNRPTITAEFLLDLFGKDSNSYKDQLFTIIEKSSPAEWLAICTACGTTPQQQEQFGNREWAELEMRLSKRD